MVVASARVGALRAEDAGHHPDRDHHRARAPGGQRQPGPASGHQGSPLPDKDSPEALGSNIPSNIGLNPDARDRKGSGPEAGHVPGDDRLHDLRGAAEDRLDAAERQSSQSCRRKAGLCSHRSRPGSFWSARAAAFARCDLAAITRRGIVSPRRSSPSRGVAPTTTPNQRPRISQPSTMTSTHRAHRGTAATDPRDARCQRRQPGAVVLPRAAARQSAPRHESGRSPRQHEHVRRPMTTAAARPSSVLPPLPCQR